MLIENLNLNLKADLDGEPRQDLCGVTFKLKLVFILGRNQSRQRERHVQRSFDLKRKARVPS